MKQSTVPDIYHYPSSPIKRKHTPPKCVDYRSYKPWLRDDFVFRCVYCLVRERWYPCGHEAFGADHVKPQSQYPDEKSTYNNLVYACNRCNTAKGTKLCLDPCVVAFGRHIEINDDGVAIGISRKGDKLIEQLNLNAPRSLRYRIRKINQHRHWNSKGDSWSVNDDRAFPDDLPDLPDSTASYFAQRHKDDLPQHY